MSDHARLLEFVTQVSRDPKKLKAIAKDPDGELGAAGLSPHEIEVLKSCDSDRIRELLTPKAAMAGFSPTITITAVIKF